MHVDLSGPEELERSLKDVCCSWTLAELRATDERVLPAGLADPLECPLSGEVPSEPVVMFWD
ncbi:hypothetical protein [Nonomuraea sp. NPDC049784]|uniref:hypothetical protein n=1 Tax=Nonomuraea sp. NPDC049784 TaxID=3154361 RepID=UPI0033FAB058